MPPIRLYCWRSLWLCSVLLASPLAQANEEGAGADQSSVLVVTAAPVKGTLDQPITAYGLVQAAPGGSVAVSSLHAAQVRRLEVIPGQAVTAGEALLDLAADPAASLAFAQARSDLKLAQAELVRTRQLVTQHLATNSQLDQAAKAVADAEMTLQARQREGGEAAVETIAAPISGVVTNVAISNGDHVQPGATLVDVAGGQSMIAVLGLAPEERSRVKAGQEVHLIDLDAPAEAITARVMSVGAMADAKTGLFPVVAAPAAHAPLVAGAHLRATIDVEGAPGWIVPRDSVLTDDQGRFLFQSVSGKAVRVAVRVLGEAGDRLAVAGPIDPARRLIVSGNYQLADGEAVREQQGNEAGKPE